ncbi:mRNA interferase MazF [Branchiibius hedensis]|uniref:mRNA interferase MazF n=1 Tax=Branchiibius hedensis TaxID=672460 RepID=A0A2Y8ZV02_9MICO|nr:type II toxin-antitoxin system PemK/MazF family toxin [Branchiibius hedensis]PWJ27310.1 mRNA interferase MazF [Branchiibius hedensis]SSA36121.1 mRNA interferase MazF [Branchiibius hedensis]
MKRGELWTVAGGVYAANPRPALLLQDDVFAATDSVTVAPLTSTLIDAPLLRILVSATDLTGLERDSAVMVDKVTTVRRTNVHHRLGRLSTENLVEVERALLVFLGLAR